MWVVERTDGAKSSSPSPTTLLPAVTGKAARSEQSLRTITITK